MPAFRILIALTAPPSGIVALLKTEPTCITGMSYYENEPGRRTGRCKDGKHHAADCLCICSRNADLRGYLRNVPRRAHRISALAPLYRHTAHTPLWVSPVLVATRPISLVFFWDSGTLGILV